MKLKAAMAALATIGASGTGMAETGGSWSVAEVRQNGQYSVIASSPPVNGATLNVVCSSPEVEGGELSIAVHDVSAPANSDHSEEAVFYSESDNVDGFLFARARRLGEGAYDAVKDGPMDEGGQPQRLNRYVFDAMLDTIIRGKTIDVSGLVFGYPHSWEVFWSFPLDGSAAAVREAVRACEHARPSGPQGADGMGQSATVRGTGKHARFGPCAMPLQP